MHITDTGRDSADFTKLAIGLMRLKKGISQAADLSPRVRGLLTNPALPMILKGSPTTSDDLSYSSLSNAFIQSLQQFSCFERILGDGSFLSVPLSSAVVRIMASVPPAGGVVAESDPVPILKLTASLDNMLVPIKVQSTVVCDEDALKIGGNEATTLIGGTLRRSLAAAIDTEFVSLIEAGAQSTASTGLDASSILADLSTALGLVTSGADQRFYYLVPAAVFKSMSVVATTGGQIAFPGFQVNSGQLGIVRVLPTEGLSGDGVLLEASQIAVGAGQVELSTSINAAVQFDDSPTGGTEVVSLFQTNRVGIRANRYMNCKPLRTTAVCKVTGMISA